MSVFRECKIDCHNHIIDPVRFPNRADSPYHPCGHEIATAEHFHQVLDRLAQLDMIAQFQVGGSVAAPGGYVQGSRRPYSDRSLWSTGSRCRCRQPRLSVGASPCRHWSRLDQGLRIRQIFPPGAALCGCPALCSGDSTRVRGGPCDLGLGLPVPEATAAHGLRREADAGGTALPGCRTASEVFLEECGRAGWIQLS